MLRFTESHITSLRCSRISTSVSPGRDFGEGGISEPRQPVPVYREYRVPSQSAPAWFGVMVRSEKKPRPSDGSGGEMTEGTEQTNHPWNTLTTVTTFDQGSSNNTRSTFCLNNVNENQNNGAVASREQQQTTAQATGVLVESLLQQLCTILEGDKVRRNKLYYAICDKLHNLRLINDTYNMTEFEMLRRQYQHAFYHMLTVARGELESENALAMSIPRFLIPKLFRYHEEFREICFIARGGFGEVYKAQHRLDGIKYAIKKIAMPVDHIETVQQQLNEVWTLAKLKHTNIVSYNAAWIEPMPNTSTSTDRKSYRSSHRSKCHQEESKYNSQSIDNLFKNGLNLNNSKICLNEQIILLDIKAPSTINMYTGRKKTRSKIYGNFDDINRSTISKRFEELNSSVNIIGERIVEQSNTEECTNKSSINSNTINEHFEEFKSSVNTGERIVEQSSTDESGSDVVSFRNNNSNENLDQTITDTDSNSSSSSSSEKSTSQEVCMYTSTKNQLHVILYIQMALCEQTLEHWLHGRRNVTPEPIVRAIFQQILCGVDYIHSQKIVHHDIKPSNIFISTTGQLQIQLGDFGLACPLQKENHHSVVGTHLYAAPEQLEGKCDPKSDIYSIGIVLIELLILIKTQMELSFIINSLKNDTSSEVFKRHKWTRVVKQLVQKDPAKRPSTSQLLKIFNDDKDVVINGLRDTIVNLQKDNHIKDNTIQELQEEIALLKEKVQKMLPDDTIN